MHAEGKSEATVKAKYKWYRRQNLKIYQKCVESRGSYNHKLEEVNSHTLMKYNIARRSARMVTGMFIRSWAANRARQIEFYDFEASTTWLDNFKKKQHRIEKDYQDGFEC